MTTEDQQIIDGFEKEISGIEDQVKVLRVKQLTVHDAMEAKLKTIPIVGGPGQILMGGK